MDSFTRKVFAFIQKNNMVEQGETLVVGFSGGADSTALMEVLRDLKGVLKIELAALHVNHGIRAEAGEDEQFVRDYCSKGSIPLKVISRDVPGISRERGLTEEEAGRLIRYEAFADYAKELRAVHIAVAHHQNDVAETLLMNLARGSGLAGAGAIKPVREKIIRPLLCVSRDEIEEYLRERGQVFCTDMTNLENDHTRNIIRNVIIPQFRDKVNSESVLHMFRAAASAGEAQEYIRQVARREYDSIARKGRDGISLDLESFRSLPEIIGKNIILLCFEDLIVSRKDFAYVHVMDVLELLGDCRGCSQIDLPYGLVAERSYDSLYIGKKREPVREIPQVPVSLGPGERKTFEIPGLGSVMAEVFAWNKDMDIPRDTYTKWFDYDRIQEVVFRTRRKRDVISIRQSDGIHTKALNKFMTDAKIPRSKREEICILADGSEVLWVPGYRRCDKYRIDDNTRYILAITIKNGGNTNG